MATFVGGSAYDVTSVSFGVEEATGAGGTQPVTVRLYTNSGGAFPAGTRTQIATTTIQVLDSASGTVLNVPLVATVPAGSELVMEVFTPNGQATGNFFFIGSNTAAETGPSYLSAADCGIANPTDTATIGFPDMNIVFNVLGTCVISTPTPSPSISPTATVSPTISPATPTPSPSPSLSPSPSASASPSPTSTPIVTPTATPSATPTPTAPPPAQAINFSTRMFVRTGDQVGIGGLIIRGIGPKRVILRAIGPSLSHFGITDFLADPVLELHGPSGFTTVINNNWRDTQEQEIQDSGIPPTNDLESAIVATLDPGNYTGVVRGNGNTVGVALIEVYDLDLAADSRLANISTRAFVSTGDDVVIAGFILGNNSGDDRVIVRGLGPSLSALGVPTVLANPALELRDNNGALIVANNDWQDNATQAAIIAGAGFAPSNAVEAAIAATLPPGFYTVLLAGLNCSTGNGLVEVYDLGDGTPFPRPTPGPAWNPLQDCGTISSPTPTITPPPSPTASPSATASPSPSPSATASPSPSASPSATASPSPSASPSATASPSPSPSATASPSPSPSPSPSATPTATPTITPTPTPTTTPTPATPTPTPATPTPTPAGPCIENFDGVPAPALPVGWVATNDQGPPPPWATSPTLADTAPNSAVVKAPAVISDKRLDSRPIAISSAAAQIRFRNHYDFQFSAGTYWDGGVLEASINGGPFVDVTHPSVGGSFVSGGYNGTIHGTAGNPISSKPAWGSSSGGYIDTVINLGAALQGQSIVLRFRMGTDQDTAGVGWRIDTISISGGACP